MCLPALAALPGLLGSAGTLDILGMTGLQALGMAGSIGSTVLSAKAAHDQASVNKRTAEINATLAQREARDAQLRGEEEAQAINRKASSLKSSQRVGLAANGLDLSYGSAADIQDQTDFFAQADIATARTNADRASYSARTRASGYSAEARSQSPFLAASTTLLTGAGRVADRWYSYTR